MNALARLEAGITVPAARRALAAAFRSAGLDTPELDGRLLLQAKLGLNHADIIASGTRMLTGNQVAQIEAAAARRLRREPVARIVGVKEFWGLPFCVSSATLVPRPETETVIEAALAAIDTAGMRSRPLKIADLGTGCGALLCALLKELPDAFGIGSDLSAAAIETASENAWRLAVSERVAFVACDFSAALMGGFDLVVSNPPYVERSAIAFLPPEVRDHDPCHALDGGPDGLSAYRTIAADAHRLLAANGCLVLEVGAGQAPAVEHIIAAAGLGVERILADLAGIPRAVLACW